MTSPGHVTPLPPLLLSVTKYFPLQLTTSILVYSRLHSFIFHHPIEKHQPATPSPLTSRWRNAWKKFVNDPLDLLFFYPRTNRFFVCRPPGADTFACKVPLGQTVLLASTPRTDRFCLWAPTNNYIATPWNIAMGGIIIHRSHSIHKLYTNLYGWVWLKLGYSCITTVYIQVMM